MTAWKHDIVRALPTDCPEQDDIATTEKRVKAPSRDNKKDTSDEIQKLKYKDPSSTKLVTLEQELVRAEAQNLVAEAQLTNNVS